MAGAYLAPNGSLFVETFNGSYVNIIDCTNSICPLEFGEVRYIPTLAGNAIYMVIFILLLLVHAYLGFRHKTWGFLVGMVAGCLIEIVGYAGRIMLWQNDFSFNAFIMWVATRSEKLGRCADLVDSYLVPLTIAPAFISAAIYTCISRLIVVYGHHAARLKPRTYTLTFIGCDLTSLVLQAAGGAIAAESTAGSSGGQTGINVMIAGLAFQVVSLTLFLVLSLDLIIRAGRKSEFELNGRFANLRHGRRFRFFPAGQYNSRSNRCILLTLPPAIVVATLLVLVRCCYRVAELQGGFGGSLANNETTFMIFEGPMIFLAVLTLAVLHPGYCFGGLEGWKSTNWTWKGKGYSEGQVVSQTVEMKSEQV